MPLFRLKAGSHCTGSGNDLRIFKSNDTQNNIVESEEELDQIDPGKFERYNGPLRSRGLKPGESGLAKVRGQEGLPNSPLPPDDMARAEAMAAGVRLNPDQAKKRAEQLRQQAQVLEDSAKATEAALMKSQKEQKQQQEDTASEEEGDLEEMTVAELRDLADTEEIDLQGATRKDEIVRAIRNAREEKG